MSNTAVVVASAASLSRARRMLACADSLFADAGRVSDPAERFCVLYLSALRAAGVILEMSEGRRHRRGGAWDRLSRARPDLRQWADYFRSLSDIRAGIEAGLPRYISLEQVVVVDSAIRDFLGSVEASLNAASSAAVTTDIAA